MILSVALTMAFDLLAASSGDRLLLCRPRIAGDPALARPEAVAQAGKQLESRFLDYGVACEGPAEGARAARRAGLSHAVTASAEGRSEGSRYVLELADAEGEKVSARRALEVATGQDAVRPLRGALSELLGTLPAAPGPSAGHAAAWTVAGVGAAAVVAGVALALSARGSAAEANAATDPATYTHARSAWSQKRSLSAVTLGAGGAALAVGLTWRFAF
ncbi:MAG TPA: hypothetical protein VML50_06775 [Anaeromyxobacter sp.]|nr:hypothetical protein [Anaeromyxobacter sp.]